MLTLTIHGLPQCVCVCARACACVCAVMATVATARVSNSHGHDGHDEGDPCPSRKEHSSARYEGLCTFDMDEGGWTHVYSL